MDRPRHKRKDPQRTGPIRNTGGALRRGEPWRELDPASSGVREGYRVIDEQIRRGQRMAQELDDEPWSDDRSEPERRRRAQYPDEPWPGYGPGYGYGYGEEAVPRYPGGLLGMPMRHMECLVREILRQISSMRPNPWRLAELLLRLQVEAVSELARLGLGAFGMAPLRRDSFAEDTDQVLRDFDDTLDGIGEDWEDVAEEDETPGDDPWVWPAAPSVPTVIRSTVPIPIYVWSHERTEIDLDLPAGAQSLELEIEPPLAVGTDEAPHPAFEAELVAIAGGPEILRVTVPHDLPAGRYPRRILSAATREPLGTLTVQVGNPPPEARTRTTPNPRKKK